MLKMWVTGLLRQRGARTALVYAGVAMAICLIAVIGVFSVSSAQSMTERALAQVPVDWQVEVRSGGNDASVRSALAALPDVRTIERVGYVDVPALETATSDGTQTTGAAVVVGLADDYLKAFPAQVRTLLSRPGGVLLAQQTAANLHASVGDTVRIGLAGTRASEVQVDGIVELPSAASLLQRVGGPAGITPPAPTDNVLLMPMRQWEKIFAGRSPSARMQFHVGFDRTRFPSSPEGAYVQAGQRVRNFEARTAGMASVADNVGSRLDAVRADAIYARILFLFLGSPAVVLSILLTASLVASDSDRRRRNEALLRLRGFDRRAIVRTIVVEEAIGAIGAALVGSSLAVLLGYVSFGSSALSPPALAWIGTSALTVMAASLLCGILPALRRLRDQTVVAGRAQLESGRRPLWQALWIDVFLIAVAGVILWRSAATNYQVVLAPEGVVASSIDYTAFLAPLAFWIGSVLLALRISSMAIRLGRVPIERAIRGVSPKALLAPVVAASLSRQHRRIATGASLAALAFSFAMATAIFDRTYENQARTDAILTNGADVAIVGNSAHPAGDILDMVRRTPEVAAAVPMIHRLAYVGNDLQDIYGVDPGTIGDATTLADAYFANRDAHATMGRLGSTPDGILVSQETVNDFQLALGDLLNLRLKVGEGYVTVPFHFVGVVDEFPTAPKDSFLVANSEYVASKTASPAAEVVLVRATSDPAATAARLRSDLGTPTPFTVTDIGEVNRTIASSLTAVDLSRLTTVELSFAGLLLAASTGLVLALGFRERRRTGEILVALGAAHRDVAAFLWSEAALVLGLGAVFGTAIGVSVAAMLVRLLSGIFDPPPDALAYPWTQIALFAAAGVMATLLAVSYRGRRSDTHFDGVPDARA